VSQYYELYIAVYGFNEARNQQVAEVIAETWEFEKPDYGMFSPTEGTEQEYTGLPMTGDGQVTFMDACAQGNVSGPPEDILQEVREAIWEHNEAYCIVECRATYLEDLPYEDFNADKEDYEEWLKSKSE